MSTSKQVKDVPAAMEIARDAAAKAGLEFNVATTARRDGGFWVVELMTFLGTFRVRINAHNGEVVEFGRIE